MRKFFKDFIDFIKKGNVLDLAVGIIIGTAFNNIVRSLVNDIIMPLIGAMGGTNIKEAKVILVDAVLNEQGEIVKNAVTLNYGIFIQFIIDFFIVAFSVFIILKIVKRLQNSAEKTKKKLSKKDQTSQETVPPKPTTEQLLTEIRDLLKNKNNNENQQ